MTCACTLGTSTPQLMVKPGNAGPANKPLPPHRGSGATPVAAVDASERAIPGVGAAAGPPRSAEAAGYATALEQPTELSAEFAVNQPSVINGVPLEMQDMQAQSGKQQVALLGVDHIMSRSARLDDSPSALPAPTAIGTLSDWAARSSIRADNPLFAQQDVMLHLPGDGTRGVAQLRPPQDQVVSGRGAQVTQLDATSFACM